MKTPCELIACYLIPYIRREIAKGLIKNHGLTQAEIARRFGVTDAAMSQYLNSKQRSNEIMDGVLNNREFKAEIEKAIDNVNHGMDPSDETCRICRFVKTKGTLTQLYEFYSGNKVPPCICGNCEPQ
ncbi:MAG: transcriptional regulator [Methanomassiliicoccus sp.]|nr:transcriptional regulator [Methanomassiliicoccus sp.]